MAEKLLIRLFSLNDTACEWALVNELGKLSSPVNKGELVDAQPQAANKQVVLIIPGEDVLLQKVTVPVNSPGKALQAIPYMLEESFSDDVETLHFALGARIAEGQFPLAVIARERMQTLCDWLDEAGLNNVLAVPEPLLLPLRESVESASIWTALQEKDRVVFRSDQYNGFSVELDSFPLILDEYLKENQEAQSDPAESDDAQQTVQQMYLINVDSFPIAIPDAIELLPETHPADEALAVFALQLTATKESINLLQGAFNRRPQLGKSLRIWRLTAILLITCLLLLSVSAAIDYVQLGQRETQLNASIEKVLKDTFPDIRRIVNPRAQMKARLNKLQKSGGGSGQFLPMMDFVAQAIGGVSGATLNSVNYRSGHVDIQIDVKQLNEIDQLKTRLEKNRSLKVSVQSANKDKNHVRGRIRLEMRP